MPSADFSVVLPVADLADALGAMGPEGIADALDAAVNQGQAKLSTDTEGRPMVAMTAVVAERMGLIQDADGRWFIADDRHTSLFAYLAQELGKVTASIKPAKRTRKARRRKRKPKPKRKKTAAQPKAATRNSFDLKALRARLEEEARNR